MSSGAHFLGMSQTPTIRYIHLRLEALDSCNYTDVFAGKHPLHGDDWNFCPSPARVNEPVWIRLQGDLVLSDAFLSNGM